MLNYLDVSSETVREIKKIYRVCDEVAFREVCRKTSMQKNAPQNVINGVCLMVDALVYKGVADKGFCTRILFKLLHYLYQLGYKDFVYITESFVFPYLKIDCSNTAGYNNS